MSAEKETLVTWNDSVELFKSNPDDTASMRQASEKLEDLIASNPQQGVSKLCYNVSLLRQLLGDKATALKFFNTCLEKDPHNAIAYFQRGIVSYQLNRFVESAKDFQKSVDCMRQATVIDYSQLGLRCKLYQHEAIYNEGACHLRLGSSEKCLDALQEVESLMRKDGGAALNTLDINTPIQSVKGGSTSIEIIKRGSDKLYTPPLNKLNNLNKKNYLGKAKVISSVQSGDTFSGFTGPQQLALPTPPERPSSPRPMTPEGIRKNGSSTDIPTLTELVRNLPTASSFESSRPEAPSRPPPKSTAETKPSPAPRANQPEPSPAPRANQPAPPKPVSRTNPEPPNKPLTPPIRTQLSADKSDAPPTRPIAPPIKPDAPPVKPAAAPKPSLCKIELIAGELVEMVTLGTNTNYIKLMDEVAKRFVYSPDTYTLWYLNRQGSYTSIDCQEVMDHVWKWKVKNNQLTVYVFGV